MKREPDSKHLHFVRCPSPDCISLRFSSDGLLRVDGVWRWADLGGWLDGIKWSARPYRTKYGAMMAAKRQDRETERAVAFMHGPLRSEPTRKGAPWPRGILGTGHGGWRT